MLINDLTAEKALEEAKKNGAVVTPSLKVLDEAAHGKVFSGRTSEGKLWKITRVNDNVYAIEIV